MENKNNNTILIILLVTFILSTLSLGGYIIYDKSINKQDINNNKISNNDTNNDNQEENDNIVLYIQSEILDLLSLNSSLVFANFSKPQNLLKENIEKNETYLIRSLQESKYNQQAPEEYPNHFLITLSNVKKYLKENFNYNYSDNEIKEYFKNFAEYDEKKDAFIVIACAHQGYITMEKIYEKDDKYYIDIYYSSDSTNKGTVVLKQENNQFYFYSSTGLN